MEYKNLFGGNDRMKKVGGYPSPYVSPKQKEKKEYGLAYFKRMYYDWKDNSEINIDSRRALYTKARSYAQGAQDTRKYKDLLDVEGDTSYLNLDWTPVNIIPKFVDLVLNDFNNQEYEVKANAIDSVAETEREHFKNSLFAKMLTAPNMEAMSKTLGRDLNHKGYVPHNQEELDIYMAVSYKQASEIAMENGIKFVMEHNNYDGIKKSILRDLIVCGLGASKVSFDPNVGVKIKYVDPANLITSFTNNENYSDIQHAGEVYSMTISELKRIAGDQLSETDYEAIASQFAGKNQNESIVSNYESYVNEENYEYYYDKFRITVLDAEFISVNELKYEKKKNSYGGYTVRKKEFKYKKPKKSKFERELIKTSIKVVYSGIWICDTDYLVNYGMAKNMVRKKSNLTETKLSYVIYAPGIYKMHNKSLVERMIPFADQIQLAHLKLQQVMAKARPKGAAFELGSLENVSKGDGGTFTPMDLQEIYDQTGNIYYRSLNDEGIQTSAVPIQELQNGIGQDMERLVSIYQHNLQMIRDVTGVNEAREGAKPSSDALVGVQKLQLMASNNATKSINDGYLSITKRLSECVCLRLQDMYKNKSKYKSYENALGKASMGMLTASKDISLHEYGVLLEVGPNEEEKLAMEANIQQSIAQKELRLEDAIFIRNIKNVKLANQVLMHRRKKYQEEEQRKAKELQIQNAQIQQQAAQQQAMMQQQMQQMQQQAEMQAAQMKSQSRIQELQAEYQLKDQLDNMQHQRRMEEIALNNSGKEKVASVSGEIKLKNQERSAVTQSRLIEQKRDRAVPITDETVKMPEEDLSPENLIEQ